MFADPAQRGVAVGVWISSFSAGGAAGPLLGGLLLDRFCWICGCSGCRRSAPR
jgi:MFS transporter, DHA2 family, multidrug resistance protein